MRQSRFRAARSVAVLVLLGVVSLHASALATAPRRAAVAVGAIAVADGHADRSAREAFATELAAQLDALAEVRVTPPRRARLVVDGTLTRFERAHEGDDVEVRCAVSLVVHDARAGAVRAVLTGRAGARAARDSEALRRVALRAAIRGALRGLSQLTAIP